MIPDPDNPQSLNRYAYCFNNPLIYIDPTGYESEGSWWSGFWNWLTGNSSQDSSSNTSNSIQLDEITVTAEKPKTSVFAYSTTETIVGTDPFGNQQSDFDFNQWFNSSEGKIASEKFTNEILPMLPIGGIAKIEQGASSLIRKSASYPPLRGFLFGYSKKVVLQVGTTVDRYGLRSGSFVSPKGVAFEARGLHPSSLNAPYEAYQVLKPISVQGGLSAPSFGYRGLGIQYELPGSVQSLIDQGYLGLVK